MQKRYEISAEKDTKELIKKYRNDLDYEIFCLGDRIAMKGVLNLFVNKIIYTMLIVNRPSNSILI